MAEGTPHEQPVADAVEERPDESAPATAEAPAAAEATPVAEEPIEAPEPEMPSEPPAVPEAPPAEEDAALESAEPEPDETAEPGDADEPAADSAGQVEVAEEEADDVAAAIAAAEETIQAEPTLDDIAPGTVVPDPQGAAAAIATEEADPNAVSAWPFVGYFGAWVAFAATLIWQLSSLPAEQAVYDSAVYGFAILGGVLLTLAGPLLILVVWFASWGRPGSSKGALLVSALVRGAIATTAGVVLWWVALIVLDYIRLGRLL